MSQQSPVTVLNVRAQSSGCLRPDWQWKNPCRECAFGAGSQLLGHASCILVGIGNAVGGASTFHQHGHWSAILIGSGTYGLFVLVRFLCGRDRKLPSLKFAILGLTFGIVVAAGIDNIQSFIHRQEMNSWLQALSDGERQEVRQNARRWLAKQSFTQRSNLWETASLMGYKSLEEFIVLNYCSKSYSRLHAMTRDASRISLR